MQRQAFELLRNGERSWWYVCRAKIISNLLGKYLPRGGEQRILDIGAGFGGMFETLSEFGAVEAVEPDSEANSFCRRKNYTAVHNTFNGLQKETYTVACLFDVLEHEQNDEGYLKSIYELEKSGGLIALTVPAYKWLWNKHDETHHHFRRYTRSLLEERLRKAGFEIIYTGYWNMLLFPIVSTLRMLGITGEGALHLSPAKDFILKKIVSIESFLIPKIKLPFGLSVIALARKP